MKHKEQLKQKFAQFQREKKISGTTFGVPPTQVKAIVAAT